MKRPTIYLSTSQVVGLHTRIMELTDLAASPVRAEGLLESAVERTHDAAHHEQADFACQAATFGVGISRYRPFVMGNKRTAYVAMLVFLELNGFAISARPLEIARNLETIVANPADLDEAIETFASWIRERLVSLDHSVRT